jgi:hypothetical protein
MDTLWGVDSDPTPQVLEAASHWLTWGSTEHLRNQKNRSKDVDENQFHYLYDMEEQYECAVILEGEATVDPVEYNSESFKVQAGDYVWFRYVPLGQML